MNTTEARRIALRLLFHLQVDQYEACYDILQEAEKAFASRSKMTQERRDEMECIANLPLDLRWINMLEKAGYIYVAELDGVDIRRMNIPQLGPKGRNAIYKAINEVREQLAQV